MDFYWTKTAGVLVLPELARQERETFLADVKDGQTVKETLQKVSAPTTNQQRKAFFAMIVSVTREELTARGHDVMGVPLTKEQAKEVVYHFCAPRDGKNKPITLSNHAESSIEHAMELFENACRWLAKTFGRVVPDPDPAWREKRHG